MARFRLLQVTPEGRRAEFARAITFAVEPLFAAGATYADLTVEQLITAVGVSRSTFYSYFADKGDLLSAMGEGAVERLLDGAAHWFELEGVVDADQVRAAITPMVDSYRSDRVIFAAITDLAGYDATIRAVHADLVGRAVVGLGAHLESRAERGQLAPGVSPADAALWVAWMLERGLYQFLAPAAGDDAERLLDAVATLIWRALYALPG